MDGCNRIAFWQEICQLFKTNQLDTARNILLSKLSSYANFEAIKSSVFLYPICTS
ncbi:NYN domain-containing protein [Streptococcus dentapri]|uniref:NYN domain-containing protein n=1 Tax=Streptococcus dentapri TaxID=573564 RepID=A0ABV8CZH6_9STRE